MENKCPKFRYEDVTKQQEQFLRRNHNYIWWMPEDESIKDPHSLLASIMRLGTLDVLIDLMRDFDSKILISVLKNAVAGEFDIESWHYWHYKLLDMSLADVPPIPIREFLNRDDFNPEMFYGHVN